MALLLLVLLPLASFVLGRTHWFVLLDARTRKDHLCCGLSHGKVARIIPAELGEAPVVWTPTDLILALLVGCFARVLVGKVIPDVLAVAADPQNVNVED